MRSGIDPLASACRFETPFLLRVMLELSLYLDLVDLLEFCVETAPVDRYVVQASDGYEIRGK
jgi:hypothetical protein